jgi:hypothetical protein
MSDYLRYVDDILIVYNVQNTGVNYTLTELCKLHHRINLTLEQEPKKIILYLTIINQ